MFAALKREQFLKATFETADSENVKRKFALLNLKLDKTHSQESRECFERNKKSKWEPQSTGVKYGSKVQKRWNELDY